MRHIARVLLVAPVVAAVVLFTAPVLAQGKTDGWTAPPLSEIHKQATARPAASSTAPGVAPSTNSHVKFISPKPGATVRGMVDAKVAGVESGGYVIYQIDGQFVYSVGTPFKLRWDTEGAEDGGHTITATAYTENRRRTGTTSVTVNVKNRIHNAIPSGGITLRVIPRRDQTIIRNVDAIAEVNGLDIREALPAGMQGVDGRLAARFSQSVMDINPATYSGNLRTSVRYGTLSTGSKEIDIQETGRYGVATLQPTGLAEPPEAGSRRPRVSLGEISLALPSGRIVEGASWESPMFVVAELVKRNTLKVTGTHTFEGVWWLKGRKCARIYSTYDVGDIMLVGKNPEDQVIASADAGGYRLGLTQGMGPGMMSMPGMMGQQGTMANPAMRQNMQGRTGTNMLRPGTQATQTATKVTARLSGLSGTRTTWIDIERGVVVKTEDYIVGTLVLAGLGDDNISPQTPTTPTSPTGRAIPQTTPGSNPNRPGMMMPGFTSAVPAETTLPYTLVLTQGGGPGMPGGPGGPGGGGGGGGTPGGGTGGGGTITPPGGGTPGGGTITTPTTNRSINRPTRTTNQNVGRTSNRGRGGTSRNNNRRNNNRNNMNRNRNQMRRVLRPLDEEPKEALPTEERLPYSLTLVVELAD